MLDTVKNDIEQNITGQFFMSYGTPTITLSSDRMQLTSDEMDKTGFILLDDSFELLIGDK